MFIIVSDSAFSIAVLCCQVY